MKKKFLTILPILLLAGCSLSINNSVSSHDGEIQEIYSLYQENGGTMTYEEWLSSIKGEKGDKGDKGDKGKSAYEIYIETYPGYTGSEEEWITDLALGKLSVQVTFVENGGAEVEDKVYCKGQEVKIFETTSKDDYSFTGWYLDPEVTNLAPTHFIATESITLYAGYHPNSVSVTYIVDGAIYKTDTFAYGAMIGGLEEAPAKLGYNFDKWKCLDESFSSSKALTEDIVLTAVYSIEELELPYIEINTENKEAVTSKETYANATISVGGTENGQYDLSNLPGKIKCRGNSTWYFAKKPYKIKFDKKQSMFGSTYKAKNWVLLANHLDKSLSRNALAYELSSKMNHIEFSSMHQYVDVYLNDEYVGVYLLCDQIESGTGRVEIDETNVTDGNGGYLLELDATERIEADGAILNESYFKSNEYSFAFKTPDIEDESFINNHEAYISYIQTYMDSCFAAMEGDDWSAITSLMDVDSFAETYIIQELYANNDCGYSSFYLVKDKDDVLKAGPVWDFDIGAGNVNYNMGTVDSCPADSTLYANNANVFYKLLLNHSEFNRIVTDYLYLYESSINEVIDLADTNYSLGIYQSYQKALTRNFSKWNILGSHVWSEPNDVAALDTIKDQLDYLYTWLSTRYAYMKNQYPQSSEE